MTKSTSCLPKPSSTRFEGHDLLVTRMVTYASIGRDFHINDPFDLNDPADMESYLLCNILRNARK